MDPRLTASIFRHLESRAALIAVLTPRELDVLGGVIAGCSSKIIGRRLGISARTVEGHRAHIIRYLGTRHIAHVICVAIEAMRQGLYPEPDPIFAAELAVAFGEPIRRIVAGERSTSERSEALQGTYALKIAGDPKRQAARLRRGPD